MSRIFQFFFSVLLLIGSTLFSGEFAYVTNNGDGTVSIIDTASNTVVGTITVGSGPFGIDVTPDGKFAYVANNGDGTVSVIDTSTNTVVGTPITVGTAPRGLAITPDGTAVYVANEGSQDVSVIDVATNTVVQTFGGIGNAPFNLVFSSDGSRVYFTIINDGNIAIVDTATKALIASVPIGSDPWGLDVTPNGQTVYVGNTGDGEAGVLDTSSLAVSLIFLNNAPKGVAVSLDGSKVYITDQVGPSDRLNIIDTATNTVTNTLLLGNGAAGIDISPNGEIAYVPNTADGTVSIVDLRSETILSTITVGASPIQVAVIPETFSVTGAAKKDSFMTETNIFNKLTWAAPDNITTNRYLIYRDSTLIATLPANQQSYIDNNLKRKRTYSYTIIAEGPGGSGAVGKVTLKTKS